MGWFDEDDDDEEDQNSRKRPQLLTDFGPGSPSTKEDSGYSATKAPPQEDGAGDNDDGDIDDPLDAYMKSLDSARPKVSGRSKESCRLDVENEEEATSHWMETHKSPTKQQDNNKSSPDDDIESNRLNFHFHKASDDRKVDIQLDKIQHATTRYVEFRKELLSSPPSSTTQGHNWRREHSISCHPPFDPIYEFAELRDTLPARVLEWIADQEGMTKPTLVQAQLFPVVLSGKDAIATASTGSGKTLSYLLPVVTHLVENSAVRSRALVLVPTRELALQVEKVAKSMLKRIVPAIRALAITGGNMGRYQLSQTLMRQKPQLIVATPGRLLDVLSAQQKSKQEWLLQEITFIVMDEADKMLQLGFASQVSQILDNLRPDRQSIMTSATWHGRLERHCQQWMHQPTRISVGRSGISSEHVQQHVMVLPSIEAKQAFLKEALPTFCTVGRTIVFCARRDGCEQLAQVLAESGMAHLQTLHGDKHPTDRQAALKAFTKGTIKLLVATDVAGRGLDIPKVAIVVNYDPAKNWDTHVHRIGRAGRLSETCGQQEGSAYTLLTPSNADFARTMVQAYEREGRDISSEVQALASRSPTTSAATGRTKQQMSRRGLGFSNDDPGSYYQPQKKSRWS